MMLLPSALPCDSRRPSLPRFGTYAVRSRSASPAPDQLPNIRTTCRALHSLLGVQPQPKAALSIITVSTIPAVAAAAAVAARPTPRPTRVVKRPPVPARGGNKRRRSVFEADYGDAFGTSDQENERPAAPATPKRQCRPRAPAHIPFGLDRADFYDLPATPPAESPRSADAMDEDVTPRRACTPPPPGSLTPKAPRRSPRLAGDGFGAALPLAAGPEAGGGDGDNDDDDWDLEDDRMLVGLVLDKLQLSRRQWDECARQLGADQRSLGARWKLLVDQGKVGLRLRRRGRRPRRDVRELWA